jgi:hypothetical protein
MLLECVRSRKPPGFSSRKLQRGICRAELKKFKRLAVRRPAVGGPIEY